LNKEEEQHVKTLINKYKDIFKLPNESLSVTNKITHKITTTDNQSINVKQYRFSPIHKEEINKQISTLSKDNIITKSESPYNSPFWIVPKKPDSKGNKQCMAYGNRL